MIEVVKVVNAVEAVEKALARKPAYLGDVTFFGADDMWQFIASHSPNMCGECEGYDMNVYFGNEIRGLFKYLEIVDENTVYTHVHPHCLCPLVRLAPVE